MLGDDFTGVLEGALSGDERALDTNLTDTQPPLLR